MSNSSTEIPDSEALSSKSPLLKQGEGFASPSRLTRLKSSFHPSELVKVDPRSLAIFRIFFGFLCLFDLMLRWPVISLLYSNSGVQPNHYALFMTPGPHGISLLYLFQSIQEVQIYFLVTGLCLIAFILGWRTRLFQLLCAIAMISLHNRNTLAHNGGDVVHNLLWLWTLFLPLGQCWSLDSFSRRLQRNDPDDQHLNAPPFSNFKPIYSLAIFGFFLQFSAIYFFNTVHKTGSTWLNGEAIYYVLEQDRIITGFGLWARESLPLGLWRMLSYGTLIIEGLAPLLILSPLWVPQTRLGAFISLVGLHLGIALVCNLGLFSWWMIAGLLLLLTRQHWDAISCWWRRRQTPLMVYYDGDCGVCTLFARCCARLSDPSLLHWEGSLTPTERPPGYSLTHFQARREVTLITWAPCSKEVYETHRAIASVFSRIPFTQPLAYALLLFGPLSLFLYRQISTHRHQLSAWLGMGLCGFRAQGDVPRPPTKQQPHLQESGLQRRLRHLKSIGVSGVIAFTIVALSFQVWAQNPWLHQFGTMKAPRWSEHFMRYGDFRQGWQMFSPDAPRSDGWMVFEIILTDGRVIDPRTGTTPRFDAPNGHHRHWGFYHEWLSDRMSHQNYYHFWRWYEAWWRNTKLQRALLKPGEEVLSFKAWWISDQTPPLGAEPRKKNLQISRKLIFSSK